MTPRSLTPPPRRARKVLKSSILVVLSVALVVVMRARWSESRPAADVARVSVPRRLTTPPNLGNLPDSLEARVGYKKIWQDYLDHDGRTLEPGVAVEATGLVAHKSLQLALDEVYSLGRGNELAQAGRIRPRAHRGELEKFVMERVASGAPATYPVLYVKDAPRVGGNLHVATGEIVALLQPGVTPAEIAKSYDLRVQSAGGSLVGLTRLVARSAFRALEIVPKLASDPRIALADHNLIKMVEPKAVKPADPLFSQQWPLLPVLDATEPNRDNNNIGIFPQGSDGTTPSVWGDFSDAQSGFRGRGIKVGIVDDGIEVNHPDLIGALDLVGEHRGYDMQEQVSPIGEVLPPRVLGTSGLGGETNKITKLNRAHGVLMSGIIGARATAAGGGNTGGIIGVAPESKLIGVRAFSYALLNGVFEAPDPTFYEPIPGDLLSPTQDVIIAAGMAYGMNDFYGLSVPGKRIYPDEFYEATLPSFADSGAGTVIHIKNMGFGSPDYYGVVDGPGPEVAGVNANGFYTPGARARAVREGRLGLGTVFVHPAGNSRYNNLDNVNNDGYANAREAITVGAVTRLDRPGPGVASSSDDAVSIFSEWGANITVVAPGGGPHHQLKGATSRLNDGRPSRAPVTGLPHPAGARIPTTDWTVNIPEKVPTATTPFLPELYGLNRGGGDGTLDYTDGKYTRQFFGTSAAAAHVSGVVALMLEANPRLSWLDVQNILIRTARIVDPLDQADPVVIDQDWFQNSGGLFFNHKYGAGLVDAYVAVSTASLGILLPPQSDMQERVVSNSTQLKLPPPTTTGPGVGELTFTPDVPPDFVVTHVQLRLDRVTSTSIGDLSVDLISPSGMVSKLLEPRIDFTDDLIDWTFGSLRYWGENGVGTWTAKFADNFLIDTVGINVLPPGVTGSPKVTLTLRGFVRPTIPTISRPESTDPTAPTVLTVTRGRNFSYNMTAANQPTTWFVQAPPPPPAPPAVPSPASSCYFGGLPPGLQLGTVVPSEATTYQSSRLITGRATAAANTTYDVTVVAANFAGVSQIHYLRFVVLPPPEDDPITQWGNFHFPPEAAENPLALGAEDAEGDGRNNVLEFGLGTSPVKSDGDGSTLLAQDELGRWNFSFNRFPTRGVIYDVQVSDVLDAASWRTVVRSCPNLVAPDPGADGIPVSLDPAFTVSEGDLVPAGDEPQSSHRLVTVVNDPTAPPPLYYRVKVIPLRDPFDPLPL